MFFWLKHSQRALISPQKKKKRETAQQKKCLLLIQNHNLKEIHHLSKVNTNLLHF